MNARAQHATAAKADEAGPRRRAKLKVIRADAARDHRGDQGAEADHLTAEKLRAGAARPLPHRAALEPLFGRDLSGVETRQGPEVDRQLEASGAEAATSGRVLLLREGAPLPVVAHELAHLLQTENPGPEAPQAALESEAMRAENAASEGVPIPAPTAALAPGATAFRATGLQVVPTPDPAARDSFRKTTAPPPQAEAPAASPSAAPAAGASAAQGNANPAPAAPQESPAAAEAPSLGPAAPAAPDVSAETLAAAGAAREQAEAAIATAEDADAVLTALAAAPPSVKARQAGGIGARMEAAQAAEQQSFNAALPPLSAEMSGTDAAPPPAELTMPAAPAAVAQADPAPAPVPEVDPTPDPGPASVGTSAATRAFVPGDPESLGAAFRTLRAEDSAVETSAGARPTVPQEGETDPARAAAEAEATGARAEEARAAATRAVIDGPGPEQAQLQSLHEELPAPAPMAPALVNPPAAEGATAFAAMPLDAETTALFDQAHGPAMAASFQGAEAEMQAATETRDQGRDEQVRSAEAQTQRLNAEADAAQQAEVTARREDIQTARQEAVDGQAEAVAELNQTASTERQSAESEIAAETARTDAQVAQSFSQAETDAEAEVARGTAEAETTRQTAESAAEEQSWWDRATDWIAAQFQQLAAAITTIFNVVRAAVRGIIDAAKAAALALIDLAARAIHTLIDAYAALLRGLVDALLSGIFPELAARLRAAIDAAAELAHRAVSAIATGLKAAVTLALDALAAGLDAVLAAWAAALNAVLTLVQAALSGDWRALARLILTPILMALGISPDGFFTLMGRAESALDTIVNAPGVFVANLIESVKGGVGLFADHFPHHLVAGIILWLTGPLGAAIQMPAQFDLWGVLDIARQLAGLTLAMLRRVAVRVIGAEAVARIEFVMNYIGAAIRDGWRGLWTQLTQDLGQLRDMVLDQIKTFLLEKVVMAAITWLASMFSPVGALVKLVMTIWNFILFLRQQIARVYPIVELVINSIADIAAGALDGPRRGVERILGRMMPIVIDLLMSLLGVTGVPDRVQTILRGVQERVEAATEALMRRVLAFFGVQGAGAAAAAPGQIMAPIAFSAGGEAHTILIEDEGETVRPIIRSTPTPLLTWLDGRMAQPFADLATSSGWTGETLARKRAEAQRLVDAAKAAETQLDASAEATENAINAAAAPNPPATAAAAATVAQANTASTGQAAKSAIMQVLEFWGIAVQPLADKYRAEIAVTHAAHPGLQDNLLIYVLRALDMARYAPFTWAQARGQIASDSRLTNAWQRPANTTGAARRWLTGFDAAVAAKAREIAREEALPGADTFLGGDTLNVAALDQFFANYLAERLNTGDAQRILVTHLLAPNAEAIEQLCERLRLPIGESTRRMCAPGVDPDADMRQITGSTYFGIFEDAASAAGRAFNYYAQQTPQGDPAPGVAAVSHPLPWFLQHSGGSPRAGANRSRVADAIRGAQPAMHEWVPASIGYAAINATSESFRERGNIDAPSGVANFVEFQNRVRTPTRDLIFKPGSFAEVTDARLPYVSRAHSTSGKVYAALTAAEKARFYPTGTTAFGQDVPVLQAHAGGLRARAERGTAMDWTYAQDASPRWHINLQDRITTEVSGNVTMRSMGEVRRAILAFYAQTIWSGRTDLPNAVFDVYQLSGGGGELTYSGVKGHAASRYQASYSNLVNEMNEVLDS